MTVASNSPWLRIAERITGKKLHDGKLMVRMVGRWRQQPWYDVWPLSCGFLPLVVFCLWLAVQGCRWNAANCTANCTAHCPWCCAVMVSVCRGWARIITMIRITLCGLVHIHRKHRLAHTTSRPPHLYTHTMIEICLTIPYRWRLSALPHPSHRLTHILSRFVPFCSLAIPTLAFALCLPSVGVWAGLSVGGPFQTVSCLQASRRPVRFPRRHPHCIVLPP